MVKLALTSIAGVLAHVRIWWSAVPREGANETERLVVSVDHAPWSDMRRVTFRNFTTYRVLRIGHHLTAEWDAGKLGTSTRV